MIPNDFSINPVLYKHYGNDQPKSNTKSKDASRTRRAQAETTGDDRPLGAGRARTVPALCGAASSVKHACETIAEVVAGYAPFVLQEQGVQLPPNSGN